MNRKPLDNLEEGTSIFHNRRADVVSMAQRRERLLNARTPAVVPVSVPEQEGVYGVSTEGSDCVISLGPIPPFRMPKAVAVKFALLILRRCGVEVEGG